MSTDPLAAILAGIPLVGISDKAAFSQVTALCGDGTNKKDLVSTKRSGLQKYKGGDYGRPRMTDAKTRMKKLSIETGRVHPKTGALLPPMEPWTCDDANGAIRLYAQIVRAPDGTFKLGDFATPAELDKIRYMRAQKLVTVEADESIVPLGDACGEAGRKYPGAPVADPLPGKPGTGAGKGHQLRELADELVLDAFRELCAENSERHDRGPGRAGMTNRDICERANQLKGRIRALDEYRYLSVETTRRCVNKLLELGALTELEPPRRVREDRTWKTLPRVFEVPLDIMRDEPAPVIEIRHAVSDLAEPMALAA